MKMRSARQSYRHRLKVKQELVHFEVGQVRTNAMPLSGTCAFWRNRPESMRHSDQRGIVDIAEKRDGNLVVLGPAGRIDNETSSSFQTRLLDLIGSGVGAVLIDFSNVEYISSAGLRALMMATKQAKATSCGLAVAGLGSMVKEIFEISRFALVVQVFETTTEAIAALR
jgi:anti-anti-sigma factor